MARPSPLETSLLLRDVTEGKAGAADKLIPLVYDELRGLAAKYLRRERRDHTLQPTALVHEAYLRLVDESRVDWQGRTHFLAIAARELRRVLIRHAHRRAAKKRGGGWARVTLNEALLPAKERDVDALDLEEALEELSSLSPRQAQVVTLWFFAGMKLEEVAHALDVSRTAVQKEWRMARAWLHRRLTRGRKG